MIDPDDELWAYSSQINFDWYDEFIDNEPDKPFAKKRDKDGCFCVKCKEFYPFAEENQPDGTMKCYSCRNPW